MATRLSETSGSVGFMEVAKRPQCGLARESAKWTYVHRKPQSHCEDGSPVATELELLSR